TELMVSAAILILVVGGIVSANLFGMRMFQVEETKLSVSDQSRKIVGVLMDEIHSCQSFQIGAFTNGMFTGLPFGTPQLGPALIIYPTTNATNFIMYFVDTAHQQFRRATSAPGSTRTLASSVTNAIDLFRAQDYLGNLLTNMQDNTVLHLKIEFYQAARFGVPPDYYKLETSTTRH
ncbi:MAG: hypothetical protein ACREIC_22145, partial [Limisphaerales bacterium]